MRKLMWLAVINVVIVTVIVVDHWMVKERLKMNGDTLIISNIRSISDSDSSAHTQLNNPVDGVRLDGKGNKPARQLTTLAQDIVSLVAHTGESRKGIGITSKMTHTTTAKLNSSHCPEVNRNYFAALQQAASEEHVLILSMIDDGFLDMVINFYEISLKPLGLVTNTLFVAPFKGTCDTIAMYHVHCYVYNDGSVQTNDAEKDSIYNSDGFIKKTNMRTKMVQDALTCGFTILVADVDIVLFKNPFPYFTCTDCDVIVQEDGNARNMNSGFVYLWPNNRTITMYRMMMDLFQNDTKKRHDQRYFNQALKKLGNKIKVQKLDNSKFKCGQCYYGVNGKGRHSFADELEPCPKCVQVHNNFIIGKQAKVYRFRETGTWLYDSGEYYSNQNRKYIMFDNPRISAADLTQVAFEDESLRDALAFGHVLNRTVILPKFFCRNVQWACSIYSRYNFLIFDNKFKEKYREHVFLMHPKVPKQIKESQSPVLVINSGMLTSNISQYDLSSVKMLHVSNPARGATSLEVQTLLKPYLSYSVIRFHSMYDAFSHFINQNTTNEFNQLLRSALLPKA